MFNKEELELILRDLGLAQFDENGMEGILDVLGLSYSDRRAALVNKIEKMLLDGNND